MKTPKDLYNESRHQDELWFTETPPGRSAYFEQALDSYRLEGRILYNTAGDAPWLLSIHGARSDLTKADAVSFGLQKRGYSLLGFNMSGHSRASGIEPGQTTLGNNIREAEAFYEHLDKKRQKIIIAYSLGGTPGLKLLERHSDEIDKLILFYPGIYTKDAYDKSFGPPFRDTISQPFSYRNTDVIELLRSFKGDLLLIKGEYDGLNPEEYGKRAGGSAGEIEIDGQTFYSPIPKEVIDMVYTAVPEVRRQLIEIPRCGHSVILWMREHPQEAEDLLDQIDTFLKR